jgi:hypothetical protein
LRGLGDGAGRGLGAVFIWEIKISSQSALNSDHLMVDR